MDMLSSSKEVTSRAGTYELICIYIFADVNKLRLSREDHPGLEKTLNLITRILMEDRERRKPFKMEQKL